MKVPNPDLQPRQPERLYPGLQLVKPGPPRIQPVCRPQWQVRPEGSTGPPRWTTSSERAWVTSSALQGLVLEGRGGSGSLHQPGADSGLQPKTQVRQSGRFVLLNPGRAAETLLIARPWACGAAFKMAGDCILINVLILPIRSKGPSHV